MAGQPKDDQEPDTRKHRSVIRWTEEQKGQIDEARKKMGLRYEADFIRLQVLRGVREVLAGGDRDVAE